MEVGVKDEIPNLRMCAKVLFLPKCLPFLSRTLLSFAVIVNNLQRFLETFTASLIFINVNVLVVNYKIHIYFSFYHGLKFSNFIFINIKLIFNSALRYR